MGTAKQMLYCSFCGKSEAEVRKLVAGPCVFICNECAELIADIMKDETIGEPMRKGPLIEHGAASAGDTMIQKATNEARESDEAWHRQKGDAQDGLAEEPTYGLPETIARAVIACLREPTEEMKTCSEEVHWGYSCHVCDGLQKGWYAMIDAALGKVTNEQP